MKSILSCLGFIALVSGVFAAVTDAPVKNDVKLSGTYYLPDQLSKKPVAKEQVAPRYPQDMAQWRVKGQVEIVFIISEKGVPEEVQVATATNQSFGAAAATAVKQWRFKPGQKDGVAVRTAILQRLEFEVQN